MSYVVYDLQKPNSTVRKLATTVADKFMTWRDQRRRLMDITDRVEVITRREET
jgi:hypothetical protein